ncbi:MAG: ABC transporter substrate-binding protein [Pleurocapsa sp.]
MGLLRSLRFLVARWLMLFFVGVLLIPLTACNPNTLLANPDRPPQLVEAIISDPKTFNFVIASDAGSSSVGSMILEGLVEQNPLTGEVEPALAESWSISDDNLEIIYTMRPNLKWSDGNPLTVDDVVFTYNQLYLNPEIPTGMRDILRIGQSGALPTVSKVNERQVKFTVPEPFAPFLSVTGASIYPAHILQKTVEQKDKDGKLKFLSTWTVDTPPEQIVASSAYKLKSYSTAERVIFDANPYYWKKALTNQDIPFIKRVIWEIVQSTDTFLIQFRSGSLDSVSVKTEYFTLLKKEEKKGNFTVYDGGPDYGTNYITFNLNTGKRNGKPLVDPIKSRWFNNVKFRQAVAYAINRPRIVKNIYRGLGQPQHSFISVQSPFADENLKAYDYDVEKAKQLLKEGGFKYNNKNQLLDADGNRVKFTLNTNSGNKVRESMGNQVEEDLEAIGMDVNFRTINFNVLIGKLSGSLDWECSMLGLTGGIDPYNGANVRSPDGNFLLFYQNPAPGHEPLVCRQVAEW